MNNNRYVLMLESDPDDRFITQSTLKESGIDVNIKFTSTSTELLDRLEDAIKPFLVLLNFNSKPLSSLDLLPKLKGDKSLNHIPVVVLGENISDEFVRRRCRQLYYEAIIGSGDRRQDPDIF